MATVKGVWILNETIDLSYFTSEHFEDVNVSVTDYNGQRVDCYKIALYSDNESLYWINLAYYDDNGVVSTLGVYHCHWGGFAPEGNGRIWNFGDTEQSVSDVFRSWLTANAKQQVDVPSATITYLGKSTELPDGKTATMPCTGKRAATDIVVAFQSAGTIDYNGTETAVEAGKVATLSCAGKKMLTDVVVAVNAGEQSKEYAITYVKNVDCTITDAPETIKEGETVSFTVQAFDVLDIVATNADIASTVGSARKYVCVLSNPTGNVTVTISEHS